VAGLPAVRVRDKYSPHPRMVESSGTRIQRFEIPYHLVWPDSGIETMYKGGRAEIFSPLNRTIYYEQNLLQL